jgi:hypothetical protein
MSKKRKRGNSSRRSRSAVHVLGGRQHVVAEDALPLRFALSRLRRPGCHCCDIATTISTANRATAI